MENFIVIMIILIIVGAASFYVYKAREKGKKCIGCADCKSCRYKDENGGCGSEYKKK